MHKADWLTLVVSNAIFCSRFRACSSEFTMSAVVMSLSFLGYDTVLIFPLIVYIFVFLLLEENFLG